MGKKATNNRKQVEIIAPCMAAGRPAKVGTRPTLDIGEANQLIGTLKARPVTASADTRQALAEAGASDD
ncbi:hypothetical protein [Microbulbifer sp. JSM ZJ756]|uniref:hypothetical protein n=1 Tax=Microbulbifer sp. JSM ZJ756 TaxID=3376191 RepID=UPI0037B21676